MSFRFNLNDILDELGITKNKLASCRGKSEASTYRGSFEGKSKRLELETIEKILNVLNDFSQTKTYTIDDIIL
ncbi:control protein [Bacillus glycinifermentans]|nr:control protein [Bacillus glycinifermentans]